MSKKVTQHRYIYFEELTILSKKNSMGHAACMPYFTHFLKVAMDFHGSNTTIPKLLLVFFKFLSIRRWEEVYNPHQSLLPLQTTSVIKKGFI